MRGNERYREELSYLVSYAASDWLHFYPVEGAARVLLGDDANEDQVRETVLSLVGDLLDAGAQAVELTSADDPAHVPWGLSRAETLARIRSELENLDDPLDSIHICWFTFPDTGSG
ncbi:hypothetical protein [Haloactinospora alba]|uniref:hypothetical protein n=1 Tax=Haloactinospora alba TaxID=405555 RepID=UPI00115362E5|nr:hypothetical protein [Haloactinospora alba]